MNLLNHLKTDRARKWMWLFLAALAALQAYFVRELIAALLLFTAGFAVLAGFALVFYVADRASQVTLAWAEPRTRTVANAARRGLDLLEEFSKRPFRRPRSEPAQ